MDGVRPPYVKRTARKSGNWANPHLEYNRFKTSQERAAEQWEARQRPHNGDHRAFNGQQRANQAGEQWAQNEKRRYSEHWGKEAFRGNEAWGNYRGRYDTLNGDYWRPVVGHNGLRSRHEHHFPGGDYRHDNIRRVPEIHQGSNINDNSNGVKDGEFQRPREPRDRGRGGGSFRRSSSYEFSREHNGRYHRRRDSETSQSSVTSGIEWDSSRTELKLSSRDPRLSRGQDYKFRQNSMDSGVPDITPSASTLSVTSNNSLLKTTDPNPDSNSNCNNASEPQASPVTGANSVQKPYNHQTIIAKYNEMCESLSRNSSAKLRDQVSEKTQFDQDSVSEHAVGKRTGSPRVLSVDADTGLVCGTTITVEELLRRKHGNRDVPKLEAIPLPPCPPFKPPLDENKRFNRSISSPADISQRRVLAPKPNNLQDQPVPYRASTIPPDDPFHSILHRDSQVRKDAIVQSAKTSPSRPSILKNSVERIRTSKSSLSRKLPSSACLTNCQASRKKRGVRFSFPSCVPGRRKTWNSISSNFDLHGKRNSPKRSPRRCSPTKSAAPPDKKRGPTGRGRDGRKATEVEAGLDKKQVKEQLFLSTFGPPVELVAKDDTTDSDAATALLLLADRSKEMPLLSPMDTDLRPTSKQRQSPTDFPPVLSPQSPPSLEPETTESGHEPSTTLAETTAEVREAPSVIEEAGSTDRLPGCDSSTRPVELCRQSRPMTIDSQSSQSVIIEDSPRVETKESNSNYSKADLGQNSVKEAERCRNKVKKKRSRRSTLLGSEAKRDIVNALEAGLVQKAITNPCFVKIRKIEDEKLADIPGRLTGLATTASMSSDCVRTLLADDVTRSDTGVTSEEPEVVSTPKIVSTPDNGITPSNESTPKNDITPNSLITPNNAGSPEAPIRHDFVSEEGKHASDGIKLEVKVEKRRSKKRTKSSPDFQGAPSPPKIRIKSEPREPVSEQSIDAKFTDISELLKDCHRKIGMTSDRSLFSSFQSGEEGRTATNEKPGLTDSVKTDTVAKTMKVDLAKLKLILSPHRIMKENSIDRRLKRSHSDECMDILRTSIARIEAMKDELKQGGLQDKNRLNEFTAQFRLPLKHQMKLANAQGGAMRRKSSCHKRPSVMVSLPLGTRDVVATSSQETPGTISDEPDRGSEQGASAPSEVVSADSDRDVESRVAVTNDEGPMETSGLSDNAPRPESRTRTSPSVGLDTDEPDLAVNALLESQLERQPSPFVTSADSPKSSSTVGDENDRRVPEVAPRPYVEPACLIEAATTLGCGQRPSEAIPSVRASSKIEGVVLSLEEHGPANESSLLEESMRSESSGDTLSDALQSSGLGTLVAPTSEPIRPGEFKPCPLHGLHPTSYQCPGQLYPPPAVTESRTMIAGQPVHYGTLMHNYGSHLPMMPMHQMQMMPPPRVGNHPLMIDQRGQPFTPGAPYPYDRPPRFADCRMPTRGEPLRTNNIVKDVTNAVASHARTPVTSPQFVSPPRPTSRAPIYSPVNRVTAPVFQPPRGQPEYSSHTTQNVLKPTPRSRVPRPRGPGRVHQRGAWNNPSTDQRPLCQQITLDLHPRGERFQGKRAGQSPDRNVFQDKLGERHSGPLETVMYSDTPLDPVVHNHKKTDDKRTLTVTVHNSLADSTFPQSDSSYVETDYSRCRQTSISSIDNTQDLAAKEDKFSENVRGQDASTPKSEVDSPDKLCNEGGGRVDGRLPGKDRVEGKNERNAQSNKGQQPDTTDNAELPTSSTDDSAGVSNPDDAFPYIPKLHWQSEPLDLSVKPGGKDGPLDLTRRTPSSEEFFVGFPLRALPPHVAAATRRSEPSVNCVVTTSASRQQGIVPLAKITAHQISGEKNVCYSPAPRSDIYQTMPPLVLEHQPPSKNGHQNVKAVQNPQPNPPPVVVRERQRELVEKQQSQERRKILEENRLLMERGSKEIVESRLQGVYSPLSQSTIDPNYPQMMYPSYPYVFPFGAMPMYQPQMMMAPSMPGQSMHGQPVGPGRPPPGHPMPPRHGQPMPRPMPGQPMVPHHMTPGQAVGYYQPMPPFTGFVPPNPIMYRPQPYEQKKRKKKPRGLVAQEDAHPLNDIGATSEDSETLSNSVQTSLKRRILDRQNADMMGHS